MRILKFYNFEIIYRCSFVIIFGDYLEIKKYLFLDLKIFKIITLHEYVAKSKP